MAASRTSSRSLVVRVAIGLAVLGGSLAGVVIARRPAPVAARTIQARLELAAGEVTLKDGSKWPSVVSGLPLAEGAELATGKGARALVRLSDGSAIFLRGDSGVTLARTGVEVARGEIWLDAPAAERGGLVHRLGDVSISAADAGLSLRRDGAEVTVYVTRGLAVVMAPGGRVEVNAGEQAVVAGNAPPRVSSVAYWEDWTGGMGDHRPLMSEGQGAGRIYGVDHAAPPGTPARTLEISRQAVKAVLRDGLAETEVDQTFGNPGGREVEGWYWFTVPERAVVTSFAVETDGQLVEGEIIEKQEAAARYQAAVRAAHEPALLEWVDGRSYRARIFPVPASGSRRVVLRYLELTGARAGKFEYVYPLRGSATDPATIGEFSLTVDLGDSGRGMPLSTLADAVIEDGGRRVTMRRSGYTPRADFQLEGQLRSQEAAFRVGRYSAGGDRADYVMARFVPEVDWAAVKQLPGDLVVVVDTSASADDAARQQKTAAAEAILRALSPSDHFSLVALDSAPVVLYPKEGLAPADEKEISVALERLAEHATGGSTDLDALFDVALGRVHGKEQPAVVYIGDGLATSGEISGGKLVERLRRSIQSSRARFFTVAVGAQANHPLLRELSRAGGGQAFRIDDIEGSTAEVLRLASAIKTPTITDLSIDLGAGLDEPMLTASGKVSRGEEVILLARTHHPLPARATVKGRLGGQDITREYPITASTGVGTALVPRLWAAEKIRRLLGESADPEQYRGKIVELGVDYGLVTPFTSILALESEAAYAHQGIRRKRTPLRGVRLTELTPRREREVVASLGGPPPFAAMGCSRAPEESAPPMQADEPPSTQSPAQTQARSSKERSMGSKGEAVAAAAAVAPSPTTASNVPTDALSKDVQATKPSPASAPMPMKGDMPIQPGLAQGRAAGLAAPTATATAAPAVAAIAPPAIAPPASAPPAIAQGAPKRPAAMNVGKLVQEKKAARDEKARPIASLPGPQPQRKQPPRPLGQCSDSARRPLAERLVVWSARLRRASSVEDLIARYEGARATCELPDWRAESALLDLIQTKVRTEGAADALLAHFAGSRETQRFLAHALLRRTVDPRIVAVVRRVLFEDKLRWIEIDNDLAAVQSSDERIAKLRQILVSYPDDPEGELRLVRELSAAGQKDEARALGRRLRERGFMTPDLAMSLGDVLAANGFEEEAVRTYSEIVEFDAGSAESRRLLGDVFLRHGWYPEAYRQYKTLNDISAEPVNLLRLASSAAGRGHIDEALRLDRQVASAEGNPGPSDPRVWARLLSASRLGRLLAAPTPATPAESLSRKLKELQVFSGPGALVILTWEDMGAALSLASMEGDKEKNVGEVTSAIPVGLISVLLPAGDTEKNRWVVRWHDDAPGRDVPFVLHTMIWDGKAFRVTVRKGTLAAKSRDVAL
jgi:Ca-activated chloride channel homolog